jgi:erythromycin esterase-like protein
MAGTFTPYPRRAGGHHRSRAAAAPLELILFDGVIGEDWSWSQRDEAMARRLLAASGPGARTLAVAGNAHTPTTAHAQITLTAAEE